MVSCYGPSVCELQQLSTESLERVARQSFNKLQHCLIRDMFLNKPQNFHKYGVEKLGSNKFHVRMEDGEVNHIHFEQYQLLDLMVVIMSNNNSKGIVFNQNVSKINGYELISESGHIRVGEETQFQMTAGDKEVFVLRFIDGAKEYLPDFK